MKDEDILFQFDLGPMKKARALKSLNQILEETQFLKRETEQIENTKFMTDELRKRAFIRSFQVIEEAAEHITQDNRDKYPFINWTEVKTIYKIISDNTYGIDYDLIWDIAANYIPTLIPKLQRVIDLLTAEK